MPKTETEWKKKLTSEQYHVMREKSTEMPFTGYLLNNKEFGMYMCSGCGAELFSSETKLNSGTGWPSFTDAIKKNIQLNEYYSHGMHRIEVTCKRCGGHLGHVFDDGPGPNKKRYCINSCCLEFKKK